MSIWESGFDTRRSVTSIEAARGLIEQLPDVERGTAGSRNLHQLDWMPEFATTSAMAVLAKEVLGASARVVRILYFDKQPGSNWKLPYHQDLTIAVADRKEMEGFGPWSVKEGIPHVQPPASVLESMVAARLHLDDCGSSNGALRVIEASHRRGKLSSAEVDTYVREREETVLEANAGDVVLMRPLLLHASSPATVPAHRRILHIEYCSASLPSPLSWHLGWIVRG